MNAVIIYLFSRTTCTAYPFAQLLAATFNIAFLSLNISNSNVPFSFLLPCVFLVIHLSAIWCFSPLLVLSVLLNSSFNVILKRRQISAQSKVLSRTLCLRIESQSTSELNSRSVWSLGVQSSPCGQGNKSLASIPLLLRSVPCPAE